MHGPLFSGRLHSEAEWHSYPEDTPLASFWSIARWLRFADVSLSPWNITPRSTTDLHDHCRVLMYVHVIPLALHSATDEMI